MAAPARRAAASSVRGGGPRCAFNDYSDVNGSTIFLLSTRVAGTTLDGAQAFEAGGVVVGRVRRRVGGLGDAVGIGRVGLPRRLQLLGLR